ncbi:hypothetical protein BOO69_16585 [Sulfitobacter alexandrii]|uniref:G domain-containing protein n=1 Tax=Sulfitobacter alexandrii TaxID=1917485 RepID=A0A1J0WKP0_9RHOB|nr:hypothetical protein BOO69_16585 [Sulfitobacter alexandrii]
MPDAAIPVLWLLGKTGAGKSSLVQALTGLSGAEVGNGFMPCTRTAEVFDYPPEQPLLRFLDTRGLGETGYDPAGDIAVCEGRAHAIIVLARLDDPVQGEVTDALAKVLDRRRMPVILGLTGADLVPDAAARARAAAAIRRQFDAATGSKIDAVEVAMPPGGEPDLGDLRAALADVLPQAALLLAARTARSTEGKAFDRVRRRVLFYAGLAGTSDVAPLIGAVSVPAAQAWMLAELGRHYEQKWTRSMSASFLGALGFGVAARYAALFGLRQVGKLVPLVGQTAVAAASGTVSFATTFALGRAAAYFLHHHRTGEAMAPADLRRVYRDALDGAVRGRSR